MSETCIIEARVIAETAAAIFVETGNGARAWVPRSICGEDTELEHKGDYGDLVLPGWIAKKKRLTD